MSKCCTFAAAHKEIFYALNTKMKPNIDPKITKLTQTLHKTDGTALAIDIEFGER